MTETARATCPWLPMSAVAVSNCYRDTFAAAGLPTPQSTGFKSGLFGGHITGLMKVADGVPDSVRRNTVLLQGQVFQFISVVNINYIIFCIRLFVINYCNYECQKLLDSVKAFERYVYKHKYKHKYSLAWVLAQPQLYIIFLGSTWDRLTTRWLLSLAIS